MPSPLQYGYRTKITPHFQAPPPKLDGEVLQKEVADGAVPDWLKIGFNLQGQNKVIDIEVRLGDIIQLVLSNSSSLYLSGVSYRYIRSKRGPSRRSEEHLSVSCIIFTQPTS